MARMLSVVQAIQPLPGSSRGSDCSEPGVAAAALEALRSSSRSGMSWTPMEKRGRSLWGGAVDARRSVTARGMFESTERSYTGNLLVKSGKRNVVIPTKITRLLDWGMGCDKNPLP
jgi:hypothetical protein